MPGSSRSHTLPGRVRGLTAAGLLISLAAPLVGIGQRFALAVPQLAPLAGGVPRLVLALAGALGEHAAGLFARRRRHEQRHRRTGDGAKDESDYDRSGTAVIARHNHSF